MPRHRFLQASGITALSAARAIGPNDRINLVLIGGRVVSRTLRGANENVAYTAVADVYETKREDARQWAGADARAFGDFRKVVELKDIDAVHIATPDQPNADIEIGHRGAGVALLGNIAMKTGKKLQWDAKKEDFTGASDASGLLGRSLRKPWDLIHI